MISRCFEYETSQRPNAKKLLQDPFFLHLMNSMNENDDMTIHSITNSFFSPDKGNQFGWEHLCSPGTLQSPGASLPKPGNLRRSTSAKCTKSPFLSPPVPKNMGTMYRGNQSSSPFMSPGKATGDWPLWARKMNSLKATTTSPRHQSHQKPVDQNIEQVTTGTLDSLAISRDSETSATAALQRKLFINQEDHLDDTTATSLQGEEFVKTL